MCSSESVLCLLSVIHSSSSSTPTYYSVLHTVQFFKVYFKVYQAMVVVVVVAVVYVSKVVCVLTIAASNFCIDKTGPQQLPT